MTTQMVRSWFPLPLADEPDDVVVSETVQRLESVHGRCAPFCLSDGSMPTSGETVAVHGPMCRSEIVASAVDGVTSAGGQAGRLLVHLVKPYLHGIYPAFDARTAQHDRGDVELLVSMRSDDGADVEGTLYLSAAAARAIGSGLIRLAEELDHPVVLGVER